MQKREAIYITSLAVCFQVVHSTVRETTRRGGEEIVILTPTYDATKPRALNGFCKNAGTPLNRTIMIQATIP